MNSSLRNYLRMAPFLLTCLGQLHAQGVAKLMDLVKFHQNIEYANVDGQSLKLDIYVPKEAGKPIPVVLWVHGGGWRQGGKGDPMPLPIVKDGFALVSINYRLSQQAKFPAQIYDCKAAVRWVRAHAAEYGFDPAKIGAIGASAGGHLVSLLGTTANDPKFEGNEGNPGVSSQVQAVCDFFGPTDFLTINQQSPLRDANGKDPITELLGGSVTEKPDAARWASPLYHVTAQASPFYIAHGDGDHVVPIEQSIELNTALQKAGVPSSLYVVKGAKHGFRDATALQNAVDFLRHYLQNTP